VQTVNLNSNKLSNVNNLFFASSLQLHFVDIGDNDLTELPIILGYLPKVGKIIVGGNGFLKGNIKSDMTPLVIKKKLRWVKKMKPGEERSGAEQSDNRVNRR